MRVAGLLDESRGLSQIWEINVQTFFLKSKKKNMLANECPYGIPSSPPVVEQSAILTYSHTQALAFKVSSKPQVPSRKRPPKTQRERERQLFSGLSPLSSILCMKCSDLHWAFSQDLSRKKIKVYQHFKPRWNFKYKRSAFLCTSPKTLNSTGWSGAPLSVRGREYSFHLLIQSSSTTLNISHLIPPNPSSFRYIALSCATVGMILQDPRSLLLCCMWWLPLRPCAGLQWRISTRKIKAWLQHMQKYFGSFSQTTRGIRHKSVCSPKTGDSIPNKDLLQAKCTCSKH